jgi:predicted glycosyltransferase/acetyltransferase-like isoleucine patch superfamily enzyme
VRYLIFTNTPAHVHLYKHVVRELHDRGHTVKILARDYGCTTDLLKFYDLPHAICGRCGTTKVSLFALLPSHYIRIIQHAMDFDPDLIFGMGAYSARAGAVTRTPTILVLDSEPTGLDHRLSRPFADAILTPSAFRKDLGANHYTFNGFKQCAYLHPDVFSPRSDVREQLGVDDESYAFIRFNAFGSYHDVGKGGFTPEQRRKLLKQLAERATVFVSDEGDDMDLSSLPVRRFDLHPALLYDALAGANLLVADSQTMVTEAALLGIPAIRSNAFVGDDDMGNFLELEEADLIYNLADFEAVLARAMDLLETDGIGERWQRRRDLYMSKKVNLTDLLVDVATSDRRLDRVDGLSTRTSTVYYNTCSESRRVSMTERRRSRVDLGCDCEIAETAIADKGKHGTTQLGDCATIRGGTTIYTDVEIGDGFATGHNALIREQTTIGDNVLVGSHTTLDGNLEVGSRVSLQTGVYLPPATTLADDIFFGPHALVTNDPYPVRETSEIDGVTVETHASVGANVTLLPGVTVGRESFVAASAVVTEDVPPETLAVGTPASHEPLPPQLQGETTSTDRRLSPSGNADPTGISVDGVDHRGRRVLGIRRQPRGRLRERPIVFLRADTLGRVVFRERRRTGLCSITRFRPGPGYRWVFS